MPHLSRSALYRCLKRWGLNRIRPTAASPTLTSRALAGPFCFDITANQVAFRRRHGRLAVQVFLAVEEVTKDVYARGEWATPEKRPDVSCQLVAQSPQKIIAVTTNPLPLFADWVRTFDEDLAAVSSHPFALVCRANRIQHTPTLTPIKSPLSRKAPSHTSRSDRLGDPSLSATIGILGRLRIEIGMAGLRLVLGSRPETLLDRDSSAFCPWKDTQAGRRAAKLSLSVRSGEKTALARRLSASRNDSTMTSPNYDQDTSKLNLSGFKRRRDGTSKLAIGALSARETILAAALWAQFTNPHGPFRDDPAITYRNYGHDTSKLRP